MHFSMLKPIKKELKRLAHKILAEDSNLSIDESMELALDLYNQLVVLHHMEKHSPPDENLHEVQPVMETINELVTELPLEEESAAINDLFASVSDPVFVKKETSKPSNSLDSKSEHGIEKNLNDVLGKGIHIGLNDRLAFIKNLFDNNAEDYQRVISQIQTCEHWEDAQQLIEQFIKPEYNHWEGKETFEKRFLKCLESNF